MVDAGGKDNLSARFSEASLNFINKVIQILCRWKDYFHDFGIIAGDAVTFDDVGDGLNKGIELAFLVRF